MQTLTQQGPIVHFLSVCFKCNLPFSHILAECDDSFGIPFLI